MKIITLVKTVIIFMSKNKYEVEKFIWKPKI